MEWNSLINFEDFSAIPTRTGLGFRVVAHGHNHTSCLARAPNAAPTWRSLERHFDLWSQEATPWVSITRSWRSAIKRSQGFQRKGARHIYIFVVDMEKLSENMLSASALASELQHGNPHLLKHEYLVWQGIPGDAFVATLPALGSAREIYIHLGKMEVPDSICNSAGGQTSELICPWVAERVRMTMGRQDHDMALRLVQSMCVKRYDDATPQWH